MPVIIKKGKISEIHQGVYGAGSNGNYSQVNAWTFRIDNFPARLKSATSNSLSNGDEITAAGEVKKGTLAIYAFRNETTGAYDEPSLTINFLLGACLVLIGIPFSFFIIGIPPLYFGIRLLSTTRKAQQAMMILAQSSKNAPD